MTKDDLKFNILYSIRYAQIRRTYFRRSQTLCTFAGLVLMFVGGFAIGCAVASAVVQVLGALCLIYDVVFGFGPKVVKLDVILDKIRCVESDFNESASCLTTDKINSLHAALERATAGDNDVALIAEYVAYNYVLDQINGDPAYKFDVGAFKRFTANLLPWSTPCKQFVDLN